MQYFIDVILPIPLVKLFTYQVNETEAQFLKPGMRVAVPFGKSKIYTAIVHTVHQTAPTTYEAKDIHQILDEHALVATKQLKFWEWISSYYLCSLGDVMRAALPSAFLLESETLISKAVPAPEEVTLTDDEYLIMEALANQSALKISELSKIINKKNVLAPVKGLLAKQYIKLREEIYEQYKPKLVKYIRLTNQYDSGTGLQELLEIVSRAKKQKEAILAYFSLNTGDETPIKAKELIEKGNCTAAVLKALVDKEIFEFYYIQTHRNHFDNSVENSKELNEHQIQALSEIKTIFEKDKVCLLRGVTASGKTEVYVKLIEEVFEANKQVLYLVPEIALTTQLVARLKAYFGDKIAVFHSKYSLNERVEVWNKVLKIIRQSSIILGARSSIFCLLII